MIYILSVLPTFVSYNLKFLLWNSEEYNHNRVVVDYYIFRTSEVLALTLFDRVCVVRV